jgi:hypothetical protein
MKVDYFHQPRPGVRGAGDASRQSSRATTLECDVRSPFLAGEIPHCGRQFSGWSSRGGRAEAEGLEARRWTLDANLVTVPAKSGPRRSRRATAGAAGHVEHSCRLSAMTLKALAQYSGRGLGEGLPASRLLQFVGDGLELLRGRLQVAVNFPGGHVESPLRYECTSRLRAAAFAGRAFAAPVLEAAVFEAAVFEGDGDFGPVCCVCSANIAE